MPKRVIAFKEATDKFIEEQTMEIWTDLGIGVAVQSAWDHYGKPRALENASCWIVDGN